MFRNIIVGIDGQDGGRDAIALAKLLLPHGGTLQLAYVYRSEAIAWRSTMAHARDAAEAALTEAASEAGVSVELCRHGAPSVGRGLHELAEKLDADLLVIGSSHHSLLGRVLIGDDTRSALNGAPCAVAIAPAGFAAHPRLVREIGVGYDGSAESEHALATARRLAREQQAKLSAFQAVFFPAHAYVGHTYPDEASLEGIIDSVRTRLNRLGGLEGHAAYGLPAEELALYSASLDLLVIGSRSYGPLGRLVHGSTAHQLASRARCPLLVLTRASREAIDEAGAGAYPETVGAGTPAA